MTRKDYQLIADVFHTRIKALEYLGLDSPLGQMYTLALAMAAALEKENPRFDRDIFLKACGV